MGKWLVFCAYKAGAESSIPGWGTKNPYGAAKKETLQIIQRNRTAGEGNHERSLS